ncbi:MAG: response regulator [Treponema sp.]|nr:response regulator [Treponema sp.]MBP5747833.1 response regulator [Treponema sp.]
MYKVLIVEDDPMVAMINQHYVEQNKEFSVSSVCKNGMEALDFLQKEAVDLIVLDVFMPQMDGIETLKHIRQKKFQAEVVMVTAANDTTTLEATMNLGVLDYLIKPFTLERFQISLEKFIERITTLKQNTTLDQSCIDSLFSKSVKSHRDDLPKGIQKRTLESLIQYFNENPGWQAVDTIAEKLGISIVTVRHYVSYMVQEKIIREEINYKTGGRPSMLYKKI